MSDSEPEEIDAIREQKKEQLLEEQQGDASTGSDGAASTPDTPIEINGAEEFNEVINRYDVVLVDCYADWCGPCKMMEPVVEELAATTDAAIAKIDVDANQQLAAKLGARSIPTLVVFANGEPVNRMVGAQDKGSLQRALQQASA